MFQQTIPGYTETVKVWDINSSKGKQFHRETIKPWIKAKALLAKYYLTAPPTSADVERLFSIASHILNKKRNRLLPRNAEHLLFVHENIANVKYEY